MSSCLARLRFAVVAVAVVSGAHAQTPPTSPPPLPTNPAAQQPAAAPAEEMVQLKLPDADIDTVLSALEIYTGKIILRPQQLATASYNIRIEKPIPKSEAIRAIETVLALNNIGIAPLDDKFLKVVNLNQVRHEAPLMITGSAFDYAPSGQAAAKLYQLEFLRVQEAQQMIGPVLNPFYGGPVVLPNANAMFITDSITNLQRVETLLQQVDKPITAGMKPKFYQLRHGAKASDVVNKLRTILGTPVMQQQLGSATTYSADDRTNQIIVVTDPRQWDFFTELIEKLDQSADPNTRTEVLYLKHATAADVVDVVTRIISGQSAALQRQGGANGRSGQLGRNQQPPKPGVQPQPQQPQVVSGSAANNPNIENLLASGSAEFSALTTVVNDERSNAVVVFGTSDDIRLVTELVEKLDLALAQVRIEVVIAEVTLSDNHQTGISQLGLQIDGDKLIGFQVAGPGFGIGGEGEDSLANITRPGVTGPWDLAGFLTLGLTDRMDNATILSVPTITTSHAKDGTVFVGETRPVISGSVISGVGGGTTSTTTQLQIGINLTVKPLIGIDGSVQLEIKQEVDEVGGSVIIDNNQQPIILKRTTESFVTVKDGEIIVLAGLQRQSNTKRTSRLGPIPIIGDLFGERQRRETRTELVFFLRPHVLTNTPADNAAIFKRVDQLPQRDAIRKHIDPNYVPPKEKLLDKILPQ